MTFDRRRSELRLAACAASIYLVSIMTTNLQNLTHTTLDAVFVQVLQKWHQRFCPNK
jgi:hypothetical protein